MSYTLLSIDPGAHNLGAAISKFDDNNFQVQKFYSLVPSKYPAEMRKHIKHFTDRTLTGKVISAMVRDLVLEYQPDFIVSEDAFYNPGRPNAFISLLVCIYAAESELYRLLCEDLISDPDRAKLYKIPPTLVKKIVSDVVGGKASKDDMTAAMEQQVLSGNIKFDAHAEGTCPHREAFTEHAVDAICIGYAFTKLWYPIIQAKALPAKITSLNKATKRHLIKNKYHSPYLK